MDCDRFAADLSAEYEMFAIALTGRYLQGVISGAATMPRLLAEIRFDGAALAQAFGDRAAQLTNRYLSCAAAPRKALFLQAVRAIATENLTSLIRLLKSGNGGLKGVLTREAGSVEQLLKRRADKPILVSHDTAGRKWKSGALVKTMARDFAYQGFIDESAASLAQQGDLAEVIYPNSTHAHHGDVLSLSGQPGHASLTDVRGTLFHPNSNARLAHHVPA